LKWKSFFKLYTVNAFNVTFDQFNVSLLNKQNIFFQQTNKEKKSCIPKTFVVQINEFSPSVNVTSGSGKKEEARIY